MPVARSAPEVGRCRKRRRVGGSCWSSRTTGRSPTSSALPAPRRVRRAGRERRRRPASRPCDGCGPPRSCSTSGCRGWTASRSADGCAPRTTGHRCSSSPPATTRSTGCSAWSWAPTTTSPSRSARASSWRGSRTVLRRSGRVAEREEVLAVGEVRVEVDRRRAHATGAEVALTSTEFDLLAHLMRAPAGCSPASSCSARCGATPRRRAPAPSTCTWPSCAPSSGRPARSAPCAGSATRGTDRP